MTTIPEKMISRIVTVDRTRTPQEALEATGRHKGYKDRRIVTSMPHGEGDKVEVFFFKLASSVNEHGVITFDQAEHEFDLRGLKPADPYSLAAVNEADPAFADEYRNCTQWKTDDGEWCIAGFDMWKGERQSHVQLSYIGGYCEPRGLVAGIRK